MPEGVAGVHLLDNVFWRSLTVEQSHFASGAGGARRYAKGFSPLLAFAEPQRPDFASIEPFCDPGDRFYVGGWAGLAPEGWRIDAEARMCQMVWDAPAPGETSHPARLLRIEDRSAMHELAMLTNPGPFGPRTPELGEYWGIFDGARLAAMAGERSHAGEFREVSGVCTHPDYRGRGWAGELVAILVRRQIGRGQVPFLHVMTANENARALYRRMGFVERTEQAVRVISKL